MTRSEQFNRAELLLESAYNCIVIAGELAGPVSGFSELRSRLAIVKEATHAIWKDAVTEAAKNGPNPCL